jgi:hypothetical protein
MAKPPDARQKDLLRPAPEEIIDLGLPLVRLAREIDWFGCKVSIHGRLRTFHRDARHASRRGAFETAQKSQGVTVPLG